MERFEIDVDMDEDLAEQFDIEALPSFVFFKNNTMLNKRVCRADISELKAMLKSTYDRKNKDQSKHEKVTSSASSSSSSNTLSTSSQNELIQFTAGWCGPCQRLHPILEKHCPKYDIEWKVLDVDDERNQEIISKLTVSSIPRLVFYKGGNIIDDFVGVDEARIKRNLELYPSRTCQKIDVTQGLIFEYEFEQDKSKKKKEK